MASTRLYGIADIAQHLGVARSAVTQWYSRSVEVAPPEPEFITFKGAFYWADLEVWDRWYLERQRLRKVGNDVKARALRGQVKRMEAEIARLERG